MQQTLVAAANPLANDPKLGEIALMVLNKIGTLDMTAETTANATQEQTFTLRRGETLSGVCSRIRAAGTAIATPECVKQILFVNRQWFYENFG